MPSVAPLTVVLLVTAVCCAILGAGLVCGIFLGTALVLESYLGLQRGQTGES